MAEQLSEPKKTTSVNSIDETLAKLNQAPAISEDFAALRAKANEGYDKALSEVKDERRRKEIIGAIGQMAAGLAGLASQRGGKMGFGVGEVKGPDTDISTDVALIADKYRQELQNIRDREQTAAAQKEKAAQRVFEAGKLKSGQAHDVSIEELRQEGRKKDLETRIEAEEEAAETAFGRKKEIFQMEAGLKRALKAGELSQAGTKEKLKATTDLRKEWNSNPITKATAEVAQAFSKVKKAAENPSPAGDLSLIFNYMKMLDPGSTVREGEFANAQNAAGIPDRIRNMYNNAIAGERLNPNQRQDFTNQANNVFKAQLEAQTAIDDRYTELATANDLPVNQVVHKNLSKISTLDQPQKSEEPSFEDMSDEDLDKEINRLLESQ